MKIDYTLWPNAEGNLGEIKVAIPDGVTEKWPTGDALVGNFVYDDGLISGFVDTKALIANESKTSTFPYDYVNITVDESLEGVMSFNQGERTKYLMVTYSKSGNSGDTITFKYKGCKTYEDMIAVDPDFRLNDIVDGVWSESLSDLEDGTFRATTGGSSGPTTQFGIFEGNKNLVVFDADLSSLTAAPYMFNNCSNLTSFKSNMKSLTALPNTFHGCTSLITFEADLSSVITNNFAFDGCISLTTFISNLSSLRNGMNMFSGCKSLCTFEADLSSLTNGHMMFNGCILNTDSVKKIAETINTVSSGPFSISIANAEPSKEEHEYFTQIHNKGWSVFVNGSSSAYMPATATLDETGETQTIPIPFWAKPIPASEEDAQYVDANGNYFNVVGGQFIYVSDPETYGMFSCEEDAIAQMRLTKIEKPSLNINFS